MITLWIFSKLLMEYRPEWQKKRDAKRWHEWEQLEDIRESMGVDANTTKILRKGYGRKKKINPRKKHAV